MTYPNNESPNRIIQSVLPIYEIPGFHVTQCIHGGINLRTSQKVQMRRQAGHELASTYKARDETRYAITYRHGEGREHTEYKFVNGKWWSGNADLQATSRVGGFPTSA